MKNRIWKSFRFQIVMYSLLSLIYTLATEAAVFYAVKLIRDMVKEKEAKKFPLTVFGGAARYPEVFNNLRQHRGGRFPYQIILIASLMIIIGIFLFILFFLLQTKKFTEYMKKITNGIDKIASGDFHSRIFIDEEDEFGQMAYQINRMAEQIGELVETERDNEDKKNEMITNVAHDLRTPLTSIIGYLDLVSGNRELDFKTKEKYIQIAYEKSKRLEKLIEDLFAYTKFSFGDTLINLSCVDIVKLLEQLLDEFYPSFDENGLDFELITSKQSCEISADGDLLARAFANLLGNAVKYGKDGKKIKITLQEEKEQVQIDFINYGQVIPEKSISYVFDRFYRVETSRSSDTGGNGLGLSIAKKIIEMHQGTIKVTSELSGTKFHVTLPIHS